MTLNERSARRALVDVRVGSSVTIADFVNAYGCEIGDGSKVGAFVEIQRDARIGRGCKISSHTFICSGVEIEDGVFVGHGVVFINDRMPRATTADGRMKGDEDWVLERTIVKRGASVGSGATVLCGVTIGERAVVGAGSVVTHDVPDRTVVAGNPARPLRQLEEDPVDRQPAR